jgi:hypothetical protein
MGVLLGVTTTAQALTTESSSGRPGWGEYYKVGGSTVPFATSSLLVPGPTVHRSPASSKTQKFVITRYLYKRIPSNPGEGLNPWTLEASYTSSAYVKRGRKLTFRDWTVPAQAYVSYHVKYGSAIYVGGTWLASALVDYNLTDDYQCLTDNCFTGNTTAGTAFITFTY